MSMPFCAICNARRRRGRRGGRGRLIFALDATASREPSWDRACRIQGEMFEATAAFGGLDVKLVFTAASTSARRAAG